MALDIEAFYEKYMPMVFRRCRQMLKNEEDALDAMQDVFVKLLNRSHSLHGQFPSSLLYTIATNTCLNLLRRKRRHGELNVDTEHLSLISNDRGYDEVEAKLLIEAILKTESESNRAIYYMYHVDGMTLQAVGNAVGMSISGVKKRLIAFNKRARMKIDFYLFKQIIVNS
jgi:RNA polymerase sigma-70 factor (ECF subfamily)